MKAAPELQPRDLSALLGTPLSEEQILAATAPLAPQLIVAGAGTGKTTVMAARVVWLVATGQVPATGVLGLTFTNKAAAELRGRIRLALARASRMTASASIVPVQTSEATVLTYHSFAGKLVGEYGLLMGLEPTAKTLTDALRSKLSYRIACTPVAQPTSESGSVASSPIRLANLISQLDDGLADLAISTAELRAFDTELIAKVAAQDRSSKLASQLTETGKSRLVLSELVDQFRAAKFAAGVQDFADQLRHASKLAERYPSVGEQLRATYPIVLLDEYQDTSRSQRRTIQLLFGSGHSVTAVGDPCQAIYGWRGASVTNIDEFPDHFPAKDGSKAEVATLKINRRSQSHIVRVANRLAADLHVAHQHVHPLVPAPGPTDVSAGEHPHGTDSTGELICALHATQDDEVTWLTERVARMLTHRDAHDIAVLCRTNEQIASMALSLQNAGVPCHIAAKQALLKLPPVTEVLNYLQVLTDPMANAALVAILSGPRYRIGPRDLALLSDRGRRLARGFRVEGTEPFDRVVDFSLLEATFDKGAAPYSEAAKQRLAEFTDLISEMRRWQLRPVAETVDWLVDRLGLPAQWLDSDLGRADSAAVSEVLAMLREFSDLDGQSHLTGFLAYVRDCDRFENQPSTEQPAQEGHVLLMTVHGAKGLEFPVVALPFVTRGSFPASRGRSRWPTNPAAVPTVIAGEPDAATEVGFPHDNADTKTHTAFVQRAKAAERLDEDRLAYVAATRAKDTLIASGHWWGNSQAKPRGPSDYLQAIRSLCEEGAGEVAHWEPEPAADAISPVLNSPARSISWPPPASQRGAATVATLVADRIATGEINSQAGRSDSVPVPPVSIPPVLTPANWSERVTEVLAHLQRPEESTAEQQRVVSATSLVNKRKDPVGFALAQRRPMPRKPSAAAAKGTKFHDWVEDRLGQQSLFEFDGSGEPHDTVTPELDDFQSAFTGTEFAERVPLVIEHPFTVMIEDQIVTGQIDAVFETAAGYEVVDWKTGSQRNADPLQLAIYRRAWAESRGVPESSIRAAFVFVATGGVQWWDQLPDLKGL
jgi:DNA helicase-2/ATP-dependent DNA helicase PcrA